MNIDSYESLTSRIGRLRLKRCGSVPALTVFVAYAPTSDYDDEDVEAFYVELEKFYKEDHTFYKVIVGDFNAKIGPYVFRKNYNFISYSDSKNVYTVWKAITLLTIKVLKKLRAHMKA
ncbi:unnamed protein product [Heligmosomoides polygyrus]|uniref:Craniofacial development protein 2-like n=1 Tax=Heligmosomoides polygyrus TaxID=6339 RepID=A0A183FMN9_HELPZ|nr:unnamed protein product [Heligmosomoides polygyrus]